ncbi:MAG: chromosomal replication initiator protein DnaA, partial [Lachnospiraceae bacterium]|nr:chromosomal replication initiator protein DnaA [Lachnospiraceae bacterium]
MNDFAFLKENWPAVLDRIREDYALTNVSFNTWILPLKIQKVENGVVTLLVPDGEIAINILTRKYTLPIRVSIEEVTGLSLEVRYVSPDMSAPEEQRNDAMESAIARANLTQKYSFDTFVVGSNNQFANAASIAVAEAPGEVYNPLYLYSDSGLGKTHLMQAICRYIIENNPNLRVLYVTSESFTNELIESLRRKTMQEFRDKYRKIDVLAIDDIQFIIGRESTQEEFFHTFNTLYGAKKQIIVSSDKPPKDLNILEDRIMSRLEMGLIADISIPDYETRMAILKRKEELEGFSIDDDVLDYIASNVKSNIRV